MLLSRCPNPDACKRDMTELARVHPYNIDNLAKFTGSNPVGNAFDVWRPCLRVTLSPPEHADPDNHWDGYMGQQCARQQGYYGLFCGSCLKGYGSTAPFQCNHCEGADSNGVVSKGTMSGLWLLYWFALSAWYTFTVMTSRPGTPDSVEIVANEDTEKYHEAGLIDIAKVSHHCVTSNTGLHRPVRESTPAIPASNMTCQAWEA